MTVKIIDSTFNPWQEIQTYQEIFSNRHPCGACSNFTTFMREQENKTACHKNPDPDTLNRIAYQIAIKWNVLDILIIYRTGEIPPGESIRLIAVWAAHPNTALEACRYLIETIDTLLTEG